MRVAKILEAEAVPKSKKLIKMKVNAGEAEPRTIVAGIAEAYPGGTTRGPHDRHVVANLEAGEVDGDRVERDGAGGESPEGGLPTLIAVDEACPPVRACADYFV